jgi:site-specific DNA-methyltransferase (adenine-specific)
MKLDTKGPVGSWMPTKDLVEWPDNPRVNDHAVDRVAKSIKDFGFASPIVVRSSNRMIIAGHTRYKAAKKLELDFVSVRFMDLTEEEARLLALADNKLGELADWHEGSLRQILDDIDDPEIAMDLGWSKEELTDLMDDVFTVEPEPERIDPIPEIGEHDSIPENIEPTTKQGDVIQLGNHVLYCSDNLEIMKGIESNSIDSIVTDPPYGIDFMNKSWDADVPQNEWARECLRVLKPGGQLISFAATRTFHKLVTNLENAGFEVRDTINWLYFSGFPKSLDLSKAIDKHFGVEREIVGKQKLTGTAKPIKGKKGHCAAKVTSAIENYEREEEAFHNITKPATEEAQQAEGIGTALKPAFEPATLCRKPLSEKTVALNWLKYKTGGINIDDCRFAYGDPCWVGPNSEKMGEGGQVRRTNPENKGIYGQRISFTSNKKKVEVGGHELGRWPANIYQCPKASRGEREEGCEDMKKTKGAAIQHHGEKSKGLNSPRAGAGRTASEVANIHPTVKPIKLMRWLIRLVTPKGGTILEPFCGSGTTMIAAELEDNNYKCIGIEREPKYCDIIRSRVKNAIDG